MGSNYYVKTFIGEKDQEPCRNKGDFYWTYHKYNNRPITYPMFVHALDNLRRFHLILVTEWLNTSSAVLAKTFPSWHVPPRKVLPHEVQALRGGGASLTAEDVMSHVEYAEMAAENVLDLLFFQLAKRIYMERLLC